LRDAAPPDAEQRGFGQAGDDAGVGDRLGRRRVEQHKIVVLPQRLQQPRHRGGHQQPERVRLAMSAGDRVHTGCLVLADHLGKCGLLPQTIHQAGMVGVCPEGRLADVAVHDDDVLAVQRGQTPERPGDRCLALLRSRGGHRDDARPVRP
jgi:hypothetical protein